jgi:hypothetical protein
MKKEEEGKSLYNTKNFGRSDNAFYAKLHEPAVTPNLGDWGGSRSPTIFPKLSTSFFENLSH